MMTCERCQFINAPNAHVCSACGHVLVARCSFCQSELPPQARFCPACGNAVRDTAVYGVGERRIVTILFADVSGFTALSESLDPERVYSLINACFDVLVPLIEKYGGSVDKFIGDEIMALFGAPVAHEDDAARALRTALEMMEALHQFNQHNSIQLGVHIGINTGLVIAGGIGSQGRRQYSVMGDAVNVAARLRAAAHTGQILVGEETYRLCKPLFEFELCESLALPGKKEFVRAYRLVRLKKLVANLRGLAGLYSPMIGRAAELNALLACSDGLLQGTGSVAVIIGEPGMGKTRLVTEWRERIPQIHVVMGACPSYGQALVYHLAGEVLRDVLGLSFVAAENEIREALQALCQRLFGEANNTVYPYLAHLLTLALDESAAQQIRLLDPQTLQSMYRTAFQQLMIAMSALSPLLILLEDIHWCDPSSALLFAQLIPLVREHRIMFCMVTRPEYDNTVQRLVSVGSEAIGQDSITLRLRALSQEESSLLVKNLLEIVDFPATVHQQILSKSEGNPFFVEEILRELIARGALMSKPEGWIVNHQAALLTKIPDNLHSLLLARIDRYSKEEKQILCLAATIGRQFSRHVIAQTLPIASRGQQLTENLENFIQQGLLHRISMDEFEFHHALLQETLYSSLLTQDRRALHLQVGDALERLGGRSRFEPSLMAHHFSQAGHAAKATLYLQMAIEQSLTAYANEEAEVYSRSALAMLTESGQRSADVLIALGESLFRQSRYGETLEVWEQAIAILQEEQQTEQMAALYARAARVAWWSGQAPLSLELCQQGIHAIEDCPRGPAVAALLHEAARAFLFNGLLGQVDGLCLQSLELARALELPEIEIEVITTQGLLARRQSRLDTAEALFRQAVARVQTTSLNSGARLMAAGRAYNNLAELLEEEYAQLPAALDIYRKSFECVARRRSPNEMLFVLNQIAFVQLLMGKFAECEAALPEMYQLAEGAATPSLGRVLLMRVEAILIYARADLTTARLMLEICCGQLRQLGDREQLARVLLNLSEICLEQQDWHAAHQALDEAHTIAQSGLASFALVLAWQSILAAQQNDAELAHRLLMRAEQVTQGSATWYDLTHQLARAWLARAQNQPHHAAQLFLNLAEQQADLSLHLPRLQTLLHGLRANVNPPEFCQRAAQVCYDLQLTQRYQQLKSSMAS